MADPFSDAVFNPNPQNPTINNRYLSSAFNHQINLSENSKLPKIDKQTIKNKLFAKHLIKSSTKLPNLKIDSNNIESQTKIKEGIMSNTNILLDKNKNRQKSQGDDFMTQIQKKLKVVLQGQQNHNFDQASDSDQDFQKKILKNKQLIKKDKLRRQIENQSMHENINNFQHQNNHIFNSQKKVESISPNKQMLPINKGKQKLDSMYEKRIRDYRQQSLGNKILLKKKQIITKEQISRKQNQQAESLPSNNFRTVKNKSSHRKIANNKKVSVKMIHSMTKQEDMFDNIHNILLNPMRKSQNDIIKQKPKTTKQHLQERLKQIQHKLVLQRKQDLQMLSRIKFVPKMQTVTVQAELNPDGTITGLNKDDHTLSWRKIEVSHAHLQARKSNFDDQIQRIHKYFQKSERSIQKYIQNQKRLVNINILKKRNEQEIYKIDV